MKNYTDVKKLIKDIDRLSPAIARRAFNDAMDKWKLPMLLPVDFTLGADEKTIEYTPEANEYTFGDVTPRTCESNPSYTGSFELDPVKHFTLQWEKALKVCITDCGKKPLNEILYKQFHQISMSYGQMLYRLFFFGGGEGLGMRGITDHQYSSVGAMPAAPTTMSLDDLINMMLADVEYMDNPKIIWSRDLYRKIFNKTSGTGTNCGTAISCLKKSLDDMAGGNFSSNDIMWAEYLDGTNVVKPNSNIYHPLASYNDAIGAAVAIADKSLYVAYDAGAVRIESSTIQTQGAGSTENTKQAKSLPWFTSSGLIIERDNSVVVRHEPV